MIFNIPNKHMAIILMTAVVVTILTLLTPGPVMLIVNTTIFIVYIIWLDKLNGGKDEKRRC